MADSCVACKGLLKPAVPTVLNTSGLTRVTPCTTLAGAGWAALVPLPLPRLDSTMKNATISATETSVAVIDVLPCHQGRVVSRRLYGSPPSEGASRLLGRRRGGCFGAVCLVHFG